MSSGSNGIGRGCKDAGHFRGFVSTLIESGKAVIEANRVRSDMICDVGTGKKCSDGAASERHSAGQELIE